MIYTNYLDEDCYDLLPCISGDDISISYRQHGGGGKIKGVEILVNCGVVLDANWWYPVDFTINFGCTEQYKSLRYLKSTKMWAWIRMLSSRSTIFIWF